MKAAVAQKLKPSPQEFKRWQRLTFLRPPEPRPNILHSLGPCSLVSTLEMEARKGDRSIVISPSCALVLAPRSYREGEINLWYEQVRESEHEKDSAHEEMLQWYLDRKRQRNDSEGASVCSNIIIFVTFLKEPDNSATSGQTQAMRWVAHVDRVLLSTQLLSEPALLREFEFFRDGLLGALKHPHPHPRHVARSMQLRGSCASKSQVLGA